MRARAPRVTLARSKNAHVFPSASRISGRCRLRGACCRLPFEGRRRGGGGDWPVDRTGRARSATRRRQGGKDCRPVRRPRRTVPPRARPRRSQDWGSWLRRRAPRALGGAREGPGGDRDRPLLWLLPGPGLSQRAAGECGASRPRSTERTCARLAHQVRGRLGRQGLFRRARMSRPVASSSWSLR